MLIYSSSPEQGHKNDINTSGFPVKRRLITSFVYMFSRVNMNLRIRDQCEYMNVSTP